MDILYQYGYELTYSLCLLLSAVAGYAIGTERENRGKPAGVGTHSLVIGGAMTFAFFGHIIAPSDPVRIAAQIVTGVGFIGAGIILRSEQGGVTNLTTAASIWMSAAIGMAIGFNHYFPALIGTIFAVLMPRVPHLSPLQ